MIVTEIGDLIGDGIMALVYIPFDFLYAVYFEKADRQAVGFSLALYVLFTAYRLGSCLSPRRKLFYLFVF